MAVGGFTGVELFYGTRAQVCSGRPLDSEKGLPVLQVLSFQDFCSEIPLSLYEADSF